MADFWIILTGSLVAVTCGLLGCYLILRRMAMIGDAISHAVLPGIVIAYLLVGAHESLFILVGAGAVGMLCTFLIEALHRRGGLQSDAAIGVVFTALFAVGIILASVYTSKIDLDMDCILYGEITFVPLDTWYISGVNLGPRAVWIIAGVLSLITAFIGFGYKELLLTTFDPAYAAALGISTSMWHYLLMAAVSLATVASFESVGAILVVAFLIAPSATAYLLTDRFPLMLLYSSLIGVLISVGGYFLAAWLDASVAGAMATMAGLIFILAFLFAPDQGLLSRRLRSRSYTV